MEVGFDSRTGMSVAELRLVKIDIDTGMKMKNAKNEE